MSNHIYRSYFRTAGRLLRQCRRTARREGKPLKNFDLQDAAETLVMVRDFHRRKNFGALGNLAAGTVRN